MYEHPFEQPMGVKSEYVNGYIPTQTLRKIKLAICNRQVDSSFFTCGLMSALVICKLKEYGHA